MEMKKTKSMLVLLHSWQDLHENEESYPSVSLVNVPPSKFWLLKARFVT